MVETNKINNMETEELYIKNLFDKHYDLFEKHYNDMVSIKTYKTIWSSSYPDFYPYQSEMGQTTAAKIYKKKPADLSDKILNKFSEDEIYYSCRYGKESWGSVFYFYNKANKVKLLFVENKNKMVLSQVDYLAIDNLFINKRLFYMRDSREKETFYIDKYSYDEKNIIALIVRNGYYNGFSNILPERTFRFNFDDSAVKIFSKQQKLNGEINESQIYPR